MYSQLLHSLVCPISVLEDMRKGHLFVSRRVPFMDHSVGPKQYLFVQFITPFVSIERSYSRHAGSKSMQCAFLYASHMSSHLTNILFSKSTGACGSEADIIRAASSQCIPGMPFFWKAETPVATGNSSTSPKHIVDVRNILFSKASARSSWEGLGTADTLHGHFMSSKSKGPQYLGRILPS
jgi:hypothetical protein